MSNELAHCNKLLIADKWQEYELVDCSDGMKLERWGKYLICRPDPQIIWQHKTSSLWERVHAIFKRDNSGDGKWIFNHSLPSFWEISYLKMCFIIKLTPFKHTGLFPEQAVNWEWIQNKIAASSRPIKVLNLFGYTGAATIAAAQAGAEVCHIDSSQSVVNWCKQNAELSGLKNAKIRYIVEDCLTFIKREQKRGHTYDAIIMDPPAFGRGRRGEIWKLEDDLWRLLQSCQKLLSATPLFWVINGYSCNISPLVLYDMLSVIVKGKIQFGELGLFASANKMMLPCGIYCRWEP